ncbi:bacteriocin fulvocin C-related protein [Streptomyces sp. NPDC054796]
MSERHTPERWVLAFDGTCGTCAAVSKAVERASEGKLEVLPLTHREVQRWLRLDEKPRTRWAPTLLRVRDEHVRAWTRPLMAVQLARRLGPRSTLRVLQSLGQLRSEARNTPARAEAENAIGRKRFLQLCGGVGVAATLTLTGQTPAFAQSEAATARKWAAANSAGLPRTYAGITRHTIPYRKAILAELSPEERGHVWIEHFNQYRAARPELTSAQNAVIEDASRIFRRVFHYERSRATEAVRELEAAAKREFGRDEAHALLARLGPADAAAASPPVLCECATDSDYCGTQCYRGGCTLVENDCGTGWLFDCNGLCSF